MHWQDWEYNYTTNVRHSYLILKQSEIVVFQTELGNFELRFFPLNKLKTAFYVYLGYVCMILTFVCDPKQYRAQTMQTN